MWIVSCEQYQRSSAYFALGLLLRHVLHLPTDAMAADVVDRVGAADPRLASWAPLVGDVLDIDVPETETTRSLEPKYLRQHTARVVADVLGHAVPDGAVLGLDDAQWIDEASREVMTRVVASIDERRFFIVATTRTEGELFGRAADRAASATRSAATSSSWPRRTCGPGRPTCPTQTSRT